MKCLYVHVPVDDLAASGRFYRTLFAAEPTVTKPETGSIEHVVTEV